VHLPFSKYTIKFDQNVEKVVMIQFLHMKNFWSATAIVTASTLQAPIIICDMVGFLIAITYTVLEPNYWTTDQVEPPSSHYLWLFPICKVISMACLWSASKPDCVL